MNEYIMFGIYCGGIIMILEGLITLIKDKPSICLISHSAFGFVCGSIGKLIYDTIKTEVYPINIYLGVIANVCLILGIFFTMISVIKSTLEKEKTK